jgi:hypothetical protein
MTLVPAQMVDGSECATLKIGDGTVVQTGIRPDQLPQWAN